jgi:hypothetical protein
MPMSAAYPAMQDISELGGTGGPQGTMHPGMGAENPIINAMRLVGSKAMQNPASAMAFKSLIESMMGGQGGGTQGAPQAQGQPPMPAAAPAQAPAPAAQPQTAPQVPVTENQQPTLQPNGMRPMGHYSNQTPMQKQPVIF